MAQVLTGRASKVAMRQVTLLRQFIDDTAFFDPPIKGVQYGDQDKLPESPWVCIEPATKTRDWPPTMTDMTEINLETIIYVYYTDSSKSEEERRLLSDQLAETIEEYFNVNHRQLKDEDQNDLVIYGYCINNEAGIALKGGMSMYKAARIIWRGRSKLRLTQAQ